MELFIPTLVVLVLGALFAFVIIPKLSPYVLGCLAILMFVLGLWQHYSMFPYEYRASMATDILKQYSGFIMLVGVIFAGTVTVLAMHGGNPPAAGDVMPELPAIPAMPNIMGSSNAKNGKNNSGGIFNLGGNANNGKPANGIMGAVTNVFNAAKPANNAKKNNNVASPSFKTV
jgi:hypothetical protein